MDVIKSLAGMVDVELTGADLAGSLDALTGNHIPVFEANQESDVTMRLRIYRRDYRKAASICKKRGDDFVLLRRKGLYWTGKGLLKRPVLLLGCILLVMLVLYVPSRVFFVRVEGNADVPTRKILAAAEQTGICFGASRREVRSERMKNELLEAMPELQWAGVNTYGCVAVITVRERSDPAQEQNLPEVGSIVAARDGVILSCTATKGSMLCRTGQAVRAGEVLISAYTDCGLCIQATLAEGEVFARTRRNLTAVTPSTCLQKTEEIDQKQNFSLIIGKNRINLWKDSGICDSSCGRMYQEYYFTLPGDFRLPVAVAVEKHTCYQTETVSLSQDVCQDVLADFAERYLLSQMAAGNILTKDQTVAEDSGAFRLEGEYTCTEMIGRVRSEQIGEYHGEDS